MSGSTIGSIAGGIIGFIVGGPFGAQIGVVAGGLIGGYIAPEHIKGPSIGDAQKQTSQAGVTRPVVYNHPAPFRGNLIDGERKARKIITEHRQGKGGPVVEEEQFLLTYCIRICETEGDISLVRAWRNGVVVYDARTTFPPGWEGYSEEVRAAQAKWLAKARLLYGGDTQMPDPALEALEHNGVGNTPYYRGSFCVVVEDDDVTDTAGAVPDYLWEVTRGATTTVLPDNFIATNNNGDQLRASPTGSAWDARSWGYGSSAYRYIAASGSTVITTDLDDYIYRSNDRGVTATRVAGPFPSLGKVVSAGPGMWVAWWNDGGTIRSLLSFDDGVSWDAIGVIASGVVPNDLSYLRGVLLFACGNTFGVVPSLLSSIDRGFTWQEVITGPDINAVGNNGDAFLASDNTGGLYFGTTGLVMSSTGESVGASGQTISGESGYFIVGTFENGIWRVGPTGAGATAVVPGPSARFYSSAAGNGYVVVGSGGGGSDVQFVLSNHGSTATLISPPISDLGIAYMGPGEDWLPVPDVPGVYYNPETGEYFNPNGYNTVTESAMTLGEIEADIIERCNVPAARVDMTAIDGIAVPGFLVAEQYSGAETLQPLMTCYMHSLPEFDARGLVARLLGGPTVLDLDEEDLLQVDEDSRDQQDDARTRPEDLDFPLKVSVVTQDPAADYASIPQTSVRTSNDVNATSEVSIQLAVPLSADDAMQLARKIHAILWSKAESRLNRTLPHEFSRLIPSDSITYQNRRWLLEETNFGDGALQLKASYERAGNFSSNATGAPVPTPTPPNSGNLYGPTIFAAMNLPQLRPQDNVPGVYMAAQGVTAGWMGADIYLSLDGEETFDLVATITQASVMGKIAADETTSGELVIRLNNPSDILENATTAQVAAGRNYAAILSAGDVAEIISFETATQDSDGFWEITNLQRGLLETTEVARIQGERFVLLKLVSFLPVDPAFDGQTLVFRAVTRGTVVDNNPTTSLVYSVPIFVLDGGGA
jgi:hypothetical protein